MSASLTLRLDDEQQRRQVNPRIKTVFVVIISFMSSDVKKGPRRTKGLNINRLWHVLVKELLQFVVGGWMFCDRKK